MKLGRTQPRSRYLPTSEINHLVTACRPGYLRSAIIIDLNTGLRKNELLSPKWAHIDFEQAVIKVEEGKGGYTRFVPMNETVRDELFRLHTREKKDYVFRDPQGKRLKDVKTSFGNVLERAKLTDVKFHDLRRTFGTMCAMRGVPPKTLQNWMGHKSIETTMKYYVVSPIDFEQEAIKRLDGIVDTHTDTTKKKPSVHGSQTLVNTKADDGN